MHATSRSVCKSVSLQPPRAAPVPAPTRTSRRRQKSRSIATPVRATRRTGALLLTRLAVLRCASRSRAKRNCACAASASTRASAPIFRWHRTLRSRSPRSTPSIRARSRSSTRTRCTRPTSRRWCSAVRSSPTTSSSSCPTLALRSTSRNSRSKTSSRPRVWASNLSRVRSRVNRFIRWSCRWSGDRWPTPSPSLMAFWPSSKTRPPTRPAPSARSKPSSRRRWASPITIACRRRSRYSRSRSAATC